MRKAEIDRKLDEIVEFAGVSRFLDTPIKRYSSGMQVRLAFSVAAHLEPEILIIDEVLAVGDLAFQKKCLGKMEAVADEGRTILFVSHNMQLIDSLCPRSLLLQAGQLVADGATRDVLEQYHESLRDTSVQLGTELDNAAYRRGSGEVRFSDIAVLDSAGAERYRYQTGETISFRFAYEVLRDVRCLHAAIMFHSGRTREALAMVRHAISRTPLRCGDRGTFTVVVPDIRLRSGSFPLYFWLGDDVARAYDVVDDMTLPLSMYSLQDDSSAGVFAIESNVIIETVRGGGDRIHADVLEAGATGS
jgi:lipopolysaccharide transport system ATP-binding protein